MLQKSKLTLRNCYFKLKITSSQERKTSLMGRHEMLTATIRGCVGVRTNSRKSVRISTVFRKHNNRRLQGIKEKYCIERIITTTLVRCTI